MWGAATYGPFSLLQRTRFRFPNPRTRSARISCCETLGSSIQNCAMHGQSMNVGSFLKRASHTPCSDFGTKSESRLEIIAAESCCDWCSFPRRKRYPVSSRDTGAAFVFDRISRWDWPPTELPAFRPGWFPTVAHNQLGSWGSWNHSWILLELVDRPSSFTRSRLWPMKNWPGCNADSSILRMIGSTLDSCPAASPTPSFFVPVLGVRRRTHLTGAPYDSWYLRFTLHLVTRGLR